LEQRGCMTSFELTYLKPDENKIERQFSYDIHAAYIRKQHFTTLLIECKYRHQGVHWVFLPRDYGGMDEFDQNTFMHPFDHFTRLKFPYRGLFPRRLAPCCSKGIELTSDGPNEKSINQALSQLAYGFAPQVAESCKTQVLGLIGKPGHIFHNVPVIVTTAALFRLNDGVSMQAIRDASSLEEVATRHHCLVQSYSAGAELEAYSRRVLGELRAQLGDLVLSESLDTFTDDLDHLFSVIVASYCPAAVVVVSVADGWAGFDTLFAYMDDLIDPSESLRWELSEQERKMEELRKKLEGNGKRKGGIRS
jgi:hypothetical protein